MIAYTFRLLLLLKTVLIPNKSITTRIIIGLLEDFLDSSLSDSWSDSISDEL